MSRAVPKVYKEPRTRNGGAALTHKLPVLFTEEEASQIIDQATVEDRSASNLIHYVMREYLAGRLRRP
jgi:hypothetical protein